MFCQECGTQMPDDSLFCPECGAKQTVDTQTQGNSVGGYVSGGSQGMQPSGGGRVTLHPKVKRTLTPEEAAKVKKRNIIIGAVTGGILLIVIIIASLMTFIKPKMKLNDYITVSYEGYETVGNAIINFDGEKFRKDYGKKLSKNLKVDESSAAEYFWEEYIYVSLDQSEGLSNGDKVKLEWTCDDEYVLKNFGYVLKYENTEYTVSGLKEAEVFDLFEGINVEFEGIAPNGEAHIVNSSSSVATDVNFELNKESGLKNGDTVTVIANIYGEDVEQYCLSNYGKVPSALSKDYTVDGLDSYVSKISEVSEDALEEMKSQAKDVYNAYMAEDWYEEDGESLTSLDYQGCYLLTNKADDSWDEHNIFYLIYKVQIHNEFKSGKKKYDKTNSIYWYISYKDILVNNKGETSVDVLDYSETYNRIEIDSGLDDGWNTKSWSYYGYESLEKLYADVVTKNAAEYNYEESINEKNSKTEKDNSSKNSKVEEEGIVFTDSSTEALKESDVKSLTDDEVQKAINEIYARNGYIFKDETKQKYYEQYDWYKGKIKSDDFSKDVFNDIEKKNIDLLEKERSKR